MARSFAARYPGIIHLGRHAVNRGEGAAIRPALALADSAFCVVQDADLDYDPREIASLLRPILGGDADVLFGSRFFTNGYRAFCTSGIRSPTDF